MNLTVVILTKDEEKSISDTLESVKFADEIIIVDDNSADNTVLIAKKYGAKIYKRSLADDFASQRNYGLEKAKGKWVLFVDADEVVSDSLKKEIIQKTSDPFTQKEGFFVTRKDVLFGKEMRYGEFGKKKILRLALRTQGKWVRRVHEIWRVTGRIGKLKGELIHYPHSSLSGFLDSINYFSSLHALANKEEGKKSSLLKILIYPPSKLIYNLTFRLTILDGLVGFVAAMMMSFHSYLSWSKLWLIQKNNR